MSAIIGLKEFGDIIGDDESKELFARCITGYIYKETMPKDEMAPEKDIKNCFIEMLNSNVIDVDRLDYLIRDAYTSGFETVNIDYTRLLYALTIVIKDSHYITAYKKGAVSIIENAIIQFEEIKCRPKETLMYICSEWGIEWSDSLMRTTRNGKKASYYNGEKEISDFDLSPVYNNYEKYFSEFDRLRVMLIQMPWQSKYGYSYVELEQFSRKEIQEMFLKRFRFENLEELSGEELGLDFRIKLQEIICEQLKKDQNVRNFNGNRRFEKYFRLIILISVYGNKVF